MALRLLHICQKDSPYWIGLASFAAGAACLLRMRLPNPSKRCGVGLRKIRGRHRGNLTDLIEMAGAEGVTHDQVKDSCLNCCGAFTTVFCFWLRRTGIIGINQESAVHRKWPQARIPTMLHKCVWKGMCVLHSTSLSSRSFRSPPLRQPCSCGGNPWPLLR